MVNGRLVQNKWLQLVLLMFFVLLACSVWAADQTAPEKKAVPSIISETQPQPADTVAKAGTHMAGRIVAAVIFIVVIFGGFMGYMFYLQRKFYQGCREDKQMATFFNSPAGLPVGTIRAIIALIIITVSLALIAINVFVGVGDFPTVLVGLLGTVLGFYFGSRSSGTGDEAAQEQIKELKTQRDDVIVKQEQSQSDTLLSKVRNGVSMSKAALEFLPEAERKKYGDVVAKIEQGLKVAEEFSKGGDLKTAAAKAGEIYELFKKENPAQGAFSKAVSAFGQVLGNSVPAIAIASSVVILCTKLAGAVYQKWKARILQAPFSPAIMTLNVVDANTGVTLIAKSPIFKKSFSKELDANDRPFIVSLTALLGQADVDAFWTQYKDRFESLQQFESGLKEFRKAAVDLELESYVTSLLPAEVGGYKGFADAIDKIGSDPQAKASLDELVIVTESLHKNGEPVPVILDKVKSGVPS